MKVSPFRNQVQNKLPEGHQRSSSAPDYKPKKFPETTLDRRSFPQPGVLGRTKQQF
jgi:hypothetical protein